MRRSPLASGGSRGSAGIVRIAWLRHPWLQQASAGHPWPACARSPHHRVFRHAEAEVSSNQSPGAEPIPMLWLWPSETRRSIWRRTSLQGDFVRAVHGCTAPACWSRTRNHAADEIPLQRRPPPIGEAPALALRRPPPKAEAPALALRRPPPEAEAVALAAAAPPGAGAPALAQSRRLRCSASASSGASAIRLLGWGTASVEVTRENTPDSSA